MSVRRITLFLLLILALQSCKDDARSRADMSEVEQAYYDDYESPENKWGYIDESGKVVIQPVYDDVKDVWDDLAAANYEGKWGYLTDKGRAVIDFEYKQAYNFSYDRAFVQDFNNQWLLIDKSGSIIDSLDYTHYQDFEGDYAVVGNDAKGVINRSGKLVAPLEFATIKINGDKLIGNKGGSYGISSLADGNEILAYDYDRLYVPKQGLIRAKSNKTYSYLDASSFAPLGSKTFTRAFDFYYELTVVKADESYQLVDKSLTVIKSLPYDKVAYIGGKRWKYKDGNKWGILDKNGEELTSAKYDLLNEYSCNRIAYCINKLWGYLDESGTEIQKPKYALVWDYSDDRARVIDRRGVGFIDLKGKMVIKDMFLEIRDFKNGIARFQTY